MPHLISRLFGQVIFLFIYLSLSETIHAQEAVPTCNACYETRLEEAIGLVNIIETHYIRYRWTETKIREVYYERLWKARSDARDPLNKEKRVKGQKENNRLTETMKVLKEQSQNASNGIVHTIQAYEDHEMRFRSCTLEDTGFRWCIRKSLQETYALLKELKAHFEHVFEQEREYRLAVKTVSGGRDGLYPYDTVEPAVDHDDYYWRFESEREEHRFREDAKVMDLLHRVKRILSWDKAGSQCCYEHS